MNFQVGCANVIRVSETEYRNYTVVYHGTKEGILDIIFHIYGSRLGSRCIDALKTDDDLSLKKVPTLSIIISIFFNANVIGLICVILIE